MDANCKLTAAEVAAAFADYPPVMTIEEAAAALRLSKHTLYDYSSRGLLKGCVRRMGKHLRFYRDRLILKAFNEGFQ